MRKTFYLLLFVLSGIAVNAQTFINSNKLWSVMQTGFCAEFCSSCFLRFAEKDTTFNEHKYRILQISNDSNMLNWSDNGYMREDSNSRVYYCKFFNGEEHLLYDFNCKVGDTLVGLYGDCCETGNVVDSIILRSLNGKSFKHYYFTNLCTGWNIVWIEGIGNTNGLLTSCDFSLVSGGAQALLCFSESDTLRYQYPGYNTCFIPKQSNNISNMNNFQPFQVYPNPSKGRFTLQIHPKFGNVHIVVYDGLGRKVLSEQVNALLYEIDLGMQKNGIYLLKAKLGNKRIVKRLMVSR